MCSVMQDKPQPNIPLPGIPASVIEELSISVRDVGTPAASTLKLGEVAIGSDGGRWLGTVPMEHMTLCERLGLMSCLLLGVSIIMTWV